MKKQVNRKSKKAPVARKKSKAAPLKVKSQESAVNSQDPQWPTLFRSLIRPGRFKYIKGMTKTSECVFCASLRAGPSPESLLVYSNDHAIVVLNKFPYNTGHLLVLPREHKAEMELLSQTQLMGLHQALRDVIVTLKKSYQPHGVNVGLNLGRAAGAGLPEHMHYHVIPRWEGDLNFFPLVAESKTIIQTLEDTYQVLRPHFEILENES